MILRRPDAILDVTANRARSDRAQPFGVSEKGEVLFDLDMSEVVPVTYKRRVQLIEQRGKFALGGDLFVTAAAFDPEFNFLGRSVFDDATKRFFHAFEIRRGGGFTFFHRANFVANVSA